MAASRVVLIGESVFFRSLSKSLYNPFSVKQQYRCIKHHVAPTLKELRLRKKQYLEELDEKEQLELNRRSNFLEWNYSSEIFAFGKRLHENIPPELLVQAFIHRSYVVQEELKQKELGIEKPAIGHKDNGELVLEGEKIISEYVPCYVSYFFPRFPLEGIESISNYLSSEKILSEVSKNLGTTFLILSTDFPVEISTYSKTLKAIVGAVKISQGTQKAKLFVRDFIITQLAGKDVNDFLNISNPLDILTEILRRDGKETPEPRIICKSAVNTILANYHVGIYCSKQLIGHCSGESVDIAIEMAALDALKRLFLTTDSCNPISYDLEKVPESVSNLKLSEWSLSAFEKQVKKP